MNNIEEKAKKLGVSTDVYVFLRRSNRKIRYFAHDLKADTIIIDDDKIVLIPAREDSLDRLEDEGVMFAADEKSVEDIVIDNLLREQLREALTQLNEKERWLIKKVFCDNKSQHELAESLGISQPAVKKRCDRIIKKLKEVMKI